MGYYTKTRTSAPEKSDPTAKNRVGEFFASAPKTRRENRSQTQQPRQENRLTSTKPASGRTLWPSRDPIGEMGGHNLYAFVGNDGINFWDFLGWLELDTSKLKQANEIETRWGQNGLMPFKNDGAGASGFHAYAADLSIKCGGGSTIKGDGTIHLNRSVTPIDPKTNKPETWPRVQGHEQRHIRSILIEIQKIVDEIKALPEPITPEEAAELTTTYQEKIEQAVLDGKGHDEKGDPNSPKPVDSKGYPPLENSPPIPPQPNPRQ